MIAKSSVRIRPATPGDVDRVNALVHSLSPESIVLRFMAGVARDVATQELRREIQRSGSEIAFIAEDTLREIVGVAYAAMMTPQDAEVAFVVRDREQHHGVGTELFGALVAELRARGVYRLHAETMPSNLAMLALLHESGFPMQQLYGDGAVHVMLKI